MYFDFHTHREPPPGVRAMVVLRPEEKARFEEAAYCCVGLHPWYLDPADGQTGFDWVAQKAADTKVLAIGETGLDKLRGPAMDFQQSIFLKHAALAESVGKPLVIHCVRAFPELLAIQRDFRPTVPWIVHGFQKGPQLAEDLLRAGFYLSFGAALLSPDGHPVVEAFRGVPHDRFFLETDDREDISIGSVYARAAAIKGVGVEEVMEWVRGNGVFF